MSSAHDRFRLYRRGPWVRFFLIRKVSWKWVGDSDLPTMLLAFYKGYEVLIDISDHQWVCGDSTGIGIGELEMFLEFLDE